MKIFSSPRFRVKVAGLVVVFGAACGLEAQATNPAVQTPSAPRQTEKAATPPQVYPPEMIKNGQDLFGQNCGFCHGRDARGGETGPDLTRSQLVTDDVKGNKIGEVIRNGRVEKGMPRFNLAELDVAALVAFIHDQKTKSETQKGGRRGVDPEDLQSGDAQAGKAYFDGPGNCTSCHSPTGNLAGIASRLKGLQLEQRLLYPRNAESKVTVTLPSGKQVAGKLAYKDEFTIGLKDSYGWYQSWPVDAVKYQIDAPAEAHVELLGKYTDRDIHNLMAYLQTLK